MNHKTTYREHAPHPALRRTVACYWSIRGTNSGVAAAQDVVVPDACMDFLFDLAGDTADLVGTMTRPLIVQRERSMDLFGVRFRPGGMGQFLRRLPADRLTDGVIRLQDLWGGAAAELLHRLQDAESTSARVHLLDEALLASIQTRSGDAVVLGVAQAIEHSEGRVLIAELARDSGLGRRQLERRFLAMVGIAPKTACRVLRFQGARRRLSAEPTHSLATVALEAGYHDQAHMTRDFVALSGTPPGAWRATLGEGGDAFVQDGESDTG